MWFPRSLLSNSPQHLRENRAAWEMRKWSSDCVFKDGYTTHWVWREYCLVLVKVCFYSIILQSLFYNSMQEFSQLSQKNNTDLNLSLNHFVISGIQWKARSTTQNCFFFFFGRGSKDCGLTLFWVAELWDLNSDQILMMNLINFVVTRPNNHWVSSSLGQVKLTFVSAKLNE